MSIYLSAFSSTSIYLSYLTQEVIPHISLYSLTHKCLLAVCVFGGVLVAGAI